MSVRNISVVGGWESDWSFLNAYQEAAEFLVDIAIEKHRQDILFFPIFFTFRHATEITLKVLIQESERYLRLSVKCGSLPDTVITPDGELSDILTSHNLGSLLNALEERLIHISEEDIPKEIRKTVLDLHLLDKNGEVFRYARSKDGKDYHPDQKRYNISEWKDRLSNALNYLAGGVGSWLDERIDTALTCLDEMDPGPL